GVIDSTGGPFGAHVTNNETQMYPDRGYDDDSLYYFMSTPGYSIQQDSAQDMNIIMSFVEVPDPTPTTVVELRYALLVSDKGEDSLKYIANKMKNAMAGDANGNGEVTVSDVVYLINALFKGGPAPWKAYADTNGDGAIGVSDVVYLINALFKGGPKSKLIWCQQRPWLNWPE
ncbi:MAG: dockerin type I repeat-containing protein, partial [candidate division Zixibacteria bacterium]|nr:dockerin type I repeat-containing protein [candidate division Zixibacteria bacterium]